MLAGHRQHVLLPAAADRAGSSRLPQLGDDVQVAGARRALPALRPQQAAPGAAPAGLCLPGVHSPVQRVGSLAACSSRAVDPAAETVALLWFIGVFIRVLL